MGVSYLKFEVSVHGMDIKDEVWTGFLAGWIRECVKSCLLGNNQKHYNFRNDFENDIEIKLVEHAGEYEIFDKENV